jgi:hypothetical protein
MAHGDRVRRLKLRLDDGSLVGHGSLFGMGSHSGFMHLSTQACLRQDLAGEAEYQRLQRLLALPGLPEVRAD